MMVHTKEGDEKMAQEKTITIDKCRNCQQDIAWLTSERTGKGYIVYIVDIESGAQEDPFADEATWIVTNNFHQCEEMPVAENSQPSA